MLSETTLSTKRGKTVADSASGDPPALLTHIETAAISFVPPVTNTSVKAWTVHRCRAIATPRLAAVLWWMLGVSAGGRAPNTGEWDRRAARRSSADNHTNLGGAWRVSLRRFAVAPEEGVEPLLCAFVGSR